MTNHCFFTRFSVGLASLPAAVLALMIGGASVFSLPAAAQGFDQSIQPMTSQPSIITLKPGDRISVSVVGFPDLSGEQVVLTDGSIQLPLVGFVNIAGLTPNQATDVIAEALIPYVRRPQVGLTVLSFSPIRVSVTGEVIQPGPRLVDRATEGNLPLTLSGVLGLAGGIKPNADLRNIIIRRNVAQNGATYPSLLARDPELRVDLWQAIQSGDLAADPQIYDGDEIIVPTATMTEGDQQLFLASTIAPQSITVQVAGEVINPGAIDVSPRTSVSAAVAAAGGLTREGSEEKITLFRIQPDGRLQQTTYEFGEDSEPLVSGDIIVVGQSTSSNIGGIFDFLGRILNPFSLFLGN